ncbi:MAG: HD domain-containing protein [Ignisphaera sp.]|nr:HD domain-containing protein [Ignisphaera sp.]MDW8085628.1 HD domain-containing protein [Ignisphaera sp.]
MVSLARIARVLQSLARSGWMLRGVSGSVAETVADHSFLTALVCIDIVERIGRHGDVGRVLLYSILHDIGEAFTGDIARGVGRELGELKRGVELKLVEEGVDSVIARRIYREYVEQSSFEAKLARLCNYIATYLTGLQYKSMGYRVSDIIENTYREIQKLSVEMNLHSVVKQYIEEESRE